MIIVFDRQGWSKVTTHWWKSASMRQQRSSICLADESQKWKNQKKYTILIHFDTHSAKWCLNFFKDSLYSTHNSISDICSIFADLFGWNTGFRTSGARSLLHFLILLWFQQQLHCKAGSHFVSLCHCLSWLFNALYGTVGEKPPWQVALNWVLRPGGEAKSYPGAPVETCIGMTLPNHWQSFELECCFD